MTGSLQTSGRSLDLDSVEQIVRFVFRGTQTTVLHGQSATWRKPIRLVRIWASRCFM